MYACSNTKKRGVNGKALRLPVSDMKLWPKNFYTSLDYVKNGYLYGVGVTKENYIAVEASKNSGGLRMGILFDPFKNTVYHACRASEDEKPCWHLAVAIDAAAAINKTQLIIPQKGPVTNINSIHCEIKSGEIELISDYTGEYLSRKNYSPREGDFKVFTLKEEITPDAVGIRGERKQKTPEGFISSIFRKVVEALTAALS